jgi:hypothetical protein
MSDFNGDICEFPVDFSTRSQEITAGVPDRTNDSQLRLAHLVNTAY